MKRTTLWASLFVLSAVGWALCVVYSLFIQPLNSIIAGRQEIWLFANATALFIGYMGALHCTALLIAPALGTAPRTGETGYMKPLEPIVVIVLLIVIDSLALLVAEPFLLAQRNESVNGIALTVPASNADIEPTDEALETLLSTTRTAGRFTGQGATLPQLLQNSRGYLDRGDFVSAHFNAQQALLLDPGNEAAQGLIIAAQEGLIGQALNAEEIDDQQLFERKRAAYLTLIEDPDPLASFTQFWELRQEFPLDADIISYMREALRRSRREAFFLEELAPLGEETSDLGPIFINPADGGQIEAVRISALIDVPYGSYSFDTELMTVDAANQVERHLAADWAKSIAGRLNMRLVDREDPQQQIEPNYYVSGTATPTAGSEYYSVQLEVGFNDLGSIARLQSDPASAALPVLWRLMDSGYGLDNRLLRLELATRLMTPLVLALFLLLFTGWGIYWKTRARGLLVLGVPASIAAAIMSIALYEYLYTRLASLLLDRLPLAAVISILAAALVLPIAWSLAFYARAMLRRS